jgi:hypothetical protein
MKTFYLLPWLAILIYGTLSCEYQLNSENFRDIAPPDTTKTIQINLSPFDRQYMFTVPTYVTYDLNTFGLNVYNVEFFVGEQSIHQGNTQTGNFMFEPSPWGIGVETMTMVVTTNTNTGSLADLLGAEGLVFQHSWEVLLDGGNPNPVEITSIENKNGVLEIEWEKYERFNFQKYILYKNFGDVEWEGEKHKIAEINNQEIHRFADSSFVGGTGIYWIEIYASNQKAISQRQRFDYPFPQLDTTWVSGGTARFNWNKNDFYNAVEKVTLTMPDYHPNPDIVLFSSENINDTAVIVDNLRFGSETDYTLSFYPKSDIRIYQDNQIARSVLTFGTGKSIPEFSKILGSPKHDNVYLYWDGTVSQHKFPGMQLNSAGESGFFTSWSVSNYDQSLITVISYQMKKFDSENLTNSTSIKPEEFDFQSFFDKTVISEKNQIVGPAMTGTGLYDLGSNKMVFTQNNENLYGSVLSPDGQYAFVKLATGFQWNSEIIIFKITNDEFEFIHKLEDKVYAQIDWIPERDHSLFILEGYEFSMPGKSDNIFKIYNASELKAEYEFKIKDGYFCGIDAETNRVAIWDEVKGSDTKQNLYIYDYTTGEIEKTIGLKHNFDVVYFWINHLFSDKGFYINPSEY